MSFSSSIFFRVLLAILGSYLIAIAASFAMIPVSLWLFTNNNHDAVFIGLMSSYVFGFGYFIWCFCCKSNNRALQHLALFTLALFSIYYLFPLELS